MGSGCRRKAAEGHQHNAVAVGIQSGKRPEPRGHVTTTLHGNQHVYAPGLPRKRPSHPPAMPHSPSSQRPLQNRRYRVTNRRAHGRPREGRASPLAARYRPKSGYSPGCHSTTRQHLFITLLASLVPDHLSALQEVLATRQAFRRRSSVPTDMSPPELSISPALLATWPAARQDSIIRSIPLPHASIMPARKTVDHIRVEGLGWMFALLLGLSPVERQFAGVPLHQLGGIDTDLDGCLLRNSPCG